VTDLGLAAEKRAALDFWGRHVEAIVKGKRRSKVLPFAPTRAWNQSAKAG